VDVASAAMFPVTVESNMREYSHHEVTKAYETRKLMARLACASSSTMLELVRSKAGSVVSSSFGCVACSDWRESTATPPPPARRPKLCHARSQGNLRCSGRLLLGLAAKCFQRHTEDRISIADILRGHPAVDYSTRFVELQHHLAG
jgi:hypothetical protein